MGDPRDTPPRGTLRARGAVPQVILAEVSPRGFLRSLGDAEELGAAGEGAPLYAFQPPPARRAGTAPPPPLLAAAPLPRSDWLGVACAALGEAGIGGGWRFAMRLAASRCAGIGGGVVSWLLGLVGGSCTPPGLGGG